MDYIIRIKDILEKIGRVRNLEFRMGKVRAKKIAIKEFFLEGKMQNGHYGPRFEFGPNDIIWYIHPTYRLSFAVYTSYTKIGPPIDLSPKAATPLAYAQGWP